MRAHSRANAITITVLTTALAVLPQPLAGASTAPPAADPAGQIDLLPTAAPASPSIATQRRVQAEPTVRCDDGRGEQAGKDLHRSGVRVLLRSNGRTWRLDFKPSDVRQGYATWSKSPYAMM
ncbi:hypothetical protein WBP06_02000 [Novosphingobium sp. BL-8H]|uniref:hypothetical protein n=1 Tax=Novosphingobium sp. BL-8H TaxID=3127640 RepID=UPI003756D60D